MTFLQKSTLPKCWLAIPMQFPIFLLQVSFCLIQKIIKIAVALECSTPVKRNSFTYCQRYALLLTPVW